MSAENEKTVTDLFNAWKRLDFIGATQLLTDSFTFQADPSVKPIEGRDAVGKEWQSYLKFMASYDFKISQILSSSNVVMVGARGMDRYQERQNDRAAHRRGLRTDRRQNQRLARLLGSADGASTGSIRVRRFTGIRAKTARRNSMLLELWSEVPLYDLGQQSIAAFIKMLATSSIKRRQIAAGGETESLGAKIDCRNVVLCQSI